MAEAYSMDSPFWTFDRPEPVEPIKGSLNKEAQADEVSFYEKGPREEPRGGGLRGSLREHKIEIQV